MKIIKVLIISLLLLCIPLIGMIVFPSEVQWTLFDFVVAFLLFAITGLFLAYMPKRFNDNRLLYSGIIIIIMIVMWLELAVGIFY